MTAWRSLVSPYINRFLSADTVVPNPANPQAFNRYTYAYNNPLRYIDPSGNIPIDCYGTNYCGASKSTLLPQAPVYTSSKPSLKPNFGGSGGNPSPTPTTTPSVTPAATVTPGFIPASVCTDPSNACATSVAAQQATPTITPTATQLVGTCGQNMSCRPAPQPYPDFDFSIDMSKVDKPDAVLDIAGIAADFYLITGEKRSGAIGEGVVTIVELASAGKTVYDAAGGDYRNLSLDALVYSIEQNPYILARVGRWIPIAGSIGSGFSLYENLSDAITITVTVEYR